MTDTFFVRGHVRLARAAEEKLVMLQLTRRGPVFSGSARDLDRLRTEFDRRHWMCLPELLTPELLHVVQRRIAEAEFTPLVHEGIGLDLCLRDEIANALLHFLANDPRLFQLIRHITGCGPIGSFVGRVYRKASGVGHYDSWHDDTLGPRLIGMSINLSAEVFSGGLFQMRDPESKRLLSEVANTGFGDGILFRLARNLEHRVTDVVGPVPKTAFAGWFQTEPDFFSVLRGSAS